MYSLYMYIYISIYVVVHPRSADYGALQFYPTLAVVYTTSCVQQRKAGSETFSFFKVFYRRSLVVGATRKHVWLFPLEE